MEFFENIWNWFVINKDAILMTLTSTQFISLVTAIVLLVKQTKSTKDNTSSTKTLNSNIENISTLTTKVTEMDTKVNTSVSALMEQNKMLTELVELQNLMISKVNLQLEAQLQVWSTIKDDSIRTNVNTILTSAKYKESSAIVELKQKIDELQSKLVTKAAELTNDVEHSVEDVKKIVNTKTIKRV